MMCETNSLDVFSGPLVRMYNIDTYIVYVFLLLYIYTYIGIDKIDNDKSY